MQRFLRLIRYPRWSTPMVEYANDGLGKPLSHDRANALFKSLQDDLVSVIAAGHDDYWNDEVVPAGTRAKIKPTSKANLIYDFICDRARIAFVDQDGMVLHEDNRSLYILLSSEAVVRFKKFKMTKEGELVTANIGTERQDDWDSQNYLPEFPSYATLVNAGYLLKRDKSAIDIIALTCRVRSIQSWRIDLFHTPSVADGLIHLATDSERVDDGYIRPIVSPKPAIKTYRSSERA